MKNIDPERLAEIFVMVLFVLLSAWLLAVLT